MREVKVLNIGMKIFEILSQPKLFGPIFHKTNTLTSFKDFDISKASPSAVLGPAIYASFGNSTWNAGHLNNGRILTGYVKGRIIDLTQPATDEDLHILGTLLGRQIDAVPLFSLERRYGSVAAGLKQAGYSAAIHEGPGRTGHHIAVFDPADIIEIPPDNR